MKIVIERKGLIDNLLENSMRVRNMIKGVMYHYRKLSGTVNGLTLESYLPLKYSPICLRNRLFL